MSLSERQYGNAARVAARTVFFRSNLLRLRLIFIAACVLAAAAVYFAGPRSAGSTDPDLARLLRGMAIIKTGILLAAGAAIWWRLGSAIRPAIAAGYIFACAAGVAGAALVWNMAGLQFAPFLFDGGLLGFLVLTLRDDSGPWLRGLTRAGSRRSE